MRAKISIVNQIKTRADEKLLRDIVKKTLKVFSPRLWEFRLSLVLLPQEKMKQFNHKYRKKNQSTDVLSFIYTSGYNKNKNQEKNNILDGEIFLCPGIISVSAKRNKISFQQELAFVLSHGILHLLGMRHGQKMYALQDKVVSSLKK